MKGVSRRNPLQLAVGSSLLIGLIVSALLAANPFARASVGFSGCGYGYSYETGYNLESGYGSGPCPTTTTTTTRLLATTTTTIRGGPTTGIGDWLGAADGGAFAHGAPFHGSAGAPTVNEHTR